MASKSNENRLENGTNRGEAEEQLESGVKFTSRKRSKKARKKLQFREEDNKAEGDEPLEMTVPEMMILKEAQELREQSRMAALTSKGSYQRPQIRDTEDKKEEADDPIGLKQSFAVEKSSHIAEERMSRYIEKRMAEKFKDRRKGDEDRKPKPEDDVYAIPDRLKVEEKPLYDPGEGLPAAGVEEVTLPEEVRLRNEAETRRAHKETLRKRAALGAKPMNNIPGNLSANFAKHRSDWMQDNATRLDEGQVGCRPEHVEDKQRKPVREDTAKRRRYEAASDALVVDRFRKRWKR